jgi:hypothetical protein
MLADDNPMWDGSSGGSGHQGPEWEQGDQERAEAFYRALTGSTKLIFDLLMDRPGERVDSAWITAQIA